VSARNYCLRAVVGAFICRSAFVCALLSLDFALQVQRENTPYSSSEPNKSDIVNRQIGGDKLKCLVKFCTGGHNITRDIAHAQWRFSIVSVSTRGLGQNVSKTDRPREAWFQRTANRK